MRYPHVESGGRYPALRTIAVLYLAGALFVTAIGIWRAVRVFMYGGEADFATNQLFGPATATAGRVLGGLGWLAVTFIAVLGMAAIAELIKLFIDIEHNTRGLRVTSARSSAMTEAAAATIPAPMGSDGRAVSAATHEGRAVPFVSDRKLFEGEETAEGALLRGH